MIVKNASNTAQSQLFGLRKSRSNSIETLINVSQIEKCVIPMDESRFS